MGTRSLDAYPLRVGGTKPAQHHVGSLPYLLSPFDHCRIRLVSVKMNCYRWIEWPSQEDRSIIEHLIPVTNQHATNVLTVRRRAIHCVFETAMNRLTTNQTLFDLLIDCLP